jgi:hypothetical protein
MTYPLRLPRGRVAAWLAGLLVLAAVLASPAANAGDASAPRDAELRATLTSLQREGANETIRNSATSFLERLSHRFPNDPYVSVQLANAYGVQARFAAARETKAVWAAKSNNVLDDVVAAHPNYPLAQATHGVQMVMAPPALGLEGRGEQILQQVVASPLPRQNEDDDEAVIISYVFLSRLYDRQAAGMAEPAQSAKRRLAEQMRNELKKRYPRFDIAQLKATN